jgi:gluconokinase
MDAKYFIGVDIGTTSTKAIVFSETGAVKGADNQEYPLLMPQLGWAEQEPEVIFEAVITAVQNAIAQSQLSKSQIAAVSFSGAMHSVIALDVKGYPLTNAIIWADNRSTTQTEQLKQSDIGHALYQRTGTPIHPMSPLPKLIWIREEKPDIFYQTDKFVSVKEYVLHHLLEEFVVDYSIASATGLFNLEQLQWDQEAIAIAGIRVDQLSQPVPTTHVLKGITTRYAEAMGLAPDTPIVVGATDGVLANLGVGAIALGQVAITIGTSSAIRTVVSQPVTDPKGRTFCYALAENRWVIGGPSNNGGIVLRWVRDQFCQPEVEQAKQIGVDPYDLMIDAAMKVSPGSEGLLCLPFLSGERAPYWNAEARGIFFGVGLHHQKAHLIRAVMEGIIFAVYSINLALQELAGDAQEIRASGGFARSSFWRQMMSDIFGYEVLVPEVYEGSAFGAAVLAMSAIGAIDQLEDVKKFIRITHSHQPDRQLSAQYQDLFKIYERIYTNTVGEFTALAQYRQQYS